jgi:hypothetical protein
LLVVVVVAQLAAAVVLVGIATLHLRFLLAPM